MKFSIASSLLVATNFLSHFAHAIPTIQAKGAKFFTSDGKQFYIKGIAYQLTNDDPLADGDQCQLDVNLMKTLGTNAIRVYHVDPAANHDVCMNALADAGIYVFLDVDTFDTYIIGKSPSWTESQFNSYSAVIDTFHKYDNVAGFFVGNEIMNSGPESIAAPYVKAAARDLKAYSAKKGYRKIPIGYSASDIPDLRPNLQNYLACGSDPANAVDFFSLNAYEWCGEQTFKSSGYVNLQAMAQGYNIPIFFSEVGCNTVKPRTFGDQSAILGPDMYDTWSGTMIYEWIEETNDYGLISYGPPAPTGGTNVVDGYTRRGTPTPVQPDFNNLKSQWQTLSPTGVALSAYTPSLSPPACPSFTAGSWLVSGDVPLPTLGQVFLNQAGERPITTSGTGSTATTSPKSGTGSSSGLTTSKTSGSMGTTGAAAATTTPSTGGASSRSSVIIPGSFTAALGGLVGAFVFGAAVLL
ncbi:glycoside hydrolase family 72 protein [Dissoconium aciculare CBS 342.82]|uniref:1,3-beta-glucanosyltransferase n=1 Tax=Dissoconium aciculare CBS 342.82 TaxID=1314786 RepID=A0A6J3MDD2_9PEZI|nr:glycoside hydrolase family 72 protein [Dissoconium aciculare CBS 342.82]KAF1825609.1 glycoside hydrolase family 72 protein [Dissoconium aciculare CBS 342.82]